MASRMNLRHLRILLVDDVVDNQILYRHFLETAGAIVEVASHGGEAIQKTRRHYFDAILMDVSMPIVDGYQATRRIRKQGYRGPILALTARDFPGEEARCLAAGYSAFYLKPISRSALLKALAQVCVDCSRMAR